MNDKEWEQLFDLIEKAINLPGMSANEKGETIREQAGNWDQATNLAEFVSMVGCD